MKNSNTLILFTLTLFLFGACGEEATDNNTKTMKNPVNTYLDSRLDAMDLAKDSLEESNNRNAEQEGLMNTLSKQ